MEQSILELEGVLGADEHDDAEFTEDDQPEPQSQSSERAARPTGQPTENDEYDPEYEGFYKRSGIGTWYRDVGGERFYFDPNDAKWYREGETPETTAETGTRQRKEEHPLGQTGYLPNHLGNHERRALAVTPYLEPEFVQPPKPSSKARYWWLVVLAIVVAGAVYLIFVRGKDAEQTTESWPAGYGDLWSCGDVVSLDGTKELGFSADQRAIMHDMAKRNERGKYLKVEGTWSFDEITRLYTVTLNGESVVYSIAEPAGGNCMLVNGDLSAANLRESWFPKPLVGPNDGVYS